MNEPIQQQQAQPVPSYQIENSIPARIGLAMSVQHAMSKRLYPQIAIREMETLVEPAPALTKREIQVWDAASELLTDYFRGNSDMDIHEEAWLEAVQIETDRRRLGHLVICGGCQGQGGNCPSCEGSGKLFIMPAPRQPRVEPEARSAPTEVTPEAKVEPEASEE